MACLLWCSGDKLRVGTWEYLDDRRGHSCCGKELLGETSDSRFRWEWTISSAHWIASFYLYSVRVNVIWGECTSLPVLSSLFYRWWIEHKFSSTLLLIQYWESEGEVWSVSLFKVLPHDSKARRLFVTSGGLKKIQEIKAEPGSLLQEYINNINSCYPEEIVRWGKWTLNYSILQNTFF